MRPPVLALFLATASAHALADLNPRTIQAQPKNKGDCHWVHGRFTLYTGDGRAMIWIIGTKRTAEIADYRDDTSGIIDAYEKRVPLNGDIDPLHADFRVCALVDSKPGHLQPVRVTDVRDATLGGKPFESGDEPQPPKP
ncbi:MAG TPA: hypothetical protein VH353_08500 [Caulobacteraceae bacterium]|nr:hypothetical protein [Caulobacteraceae bacterium]